MIRRDSANRNLQKYTELLLPISIILSWLFFNALDLIYDYVPSTLLFFFYINLVHLTTYSCLQNSGYKMQEENKHVRIISSLMLILSFVLMFYFFHLLFILKVVMSAFVIILVLNFTNFRIRFFYILELLITFCFFLVFIQFASSLQTETVWIWLLTESNLSFFGMKYEFIIFLIRCCNIYIYTTLISYLPYRIHYR